MNPKLSILIVTWNSWHDLKRCLESIYAMNYQDYEVVVVDNGSIDNTVEKLKQQFPEVRLQQNSINLGLPPAVNQGLRLTTGDYVMLLDVDTEVSPDTVNVLMDFMQQREDVSLIAPRIYTPEGNIEQSARNLPSISSGLFGRQSFLTRVFPNNPFTRRYLIPQNLNKSEPFQVGQVSAACMFMRRTLIDEAGPWDEGYRCYWIDSDWCAQVKAVGKTIYCVPGASIVHYENNRATKKKSPWRIWHFHTGAFRLYRKHYTWGILDPRALFAAAALFTRAGCLLFLNAMKSSTPDETNKQHSIRKRYSPMEKSNVNESAPNAYKYNTNERRAKAHVDTHTEIDEPLKLIAIPYTPSSASLAQKFLDAIYHLLEVLLAMVAIILLSPIFLVLAILVKRDSPGPAIFVMSRTGQSKPVKGSILIDNDLVKPPHGGFEPDRTYWLPRKISFMKYRTMYVDSKERFPEYYWWNYNLNKDEVRHMFYKVENDPRLTPVGKWLRKSSLDELPNLFNVITGDVRLVGPRPEGFDILRFYLEDEMQKFTVKPGLTCYSKIYGRGELSVEEQIKWDLDYVKNRTVWLDIKIVFLTIWMILTQRGAF